MYKFQNSTLTSTYDKKLYFKITITKAIARSSGRGDIGLCHYKWNSFFVPLTMATFKLHLRNVGAETIEKVIFIQVKSKLAMEYFLSFRISLLEYTNKSSHVKKKKAINFEPPVSTFKLLIIMSDLFTVTLLQTRFVKLWLKTVTISIWCTTPSLYFKQYRISNVWKLILSVHIRVLKSRIPLSAHKLTCNFPPNNYIKPFYSQQFIDFIFNPLRQHCLYN